MSSILKNVSGQHIKFCMVSASTGAADASASLTGSYVTKDGGSQASVGGTFTNLGNGQYDYAPTQTETNATDVGFLFLSSGDVPVNADFHTNLADANGNLLVDVAYINAVATSSVTTVSANIGTTQPLNFTGTGGSALAQSDVQDWKGTAVSSPATAGIPDVNAKNINNVSTGSVTAINANQGTTQPINFTGTGGSALVKSDMQDIAGAAVSTTTAQIGANVVNIAGQAAALDGNNLLKVDVEDINGNATAAQNVSKANQAIGRGTCTTGGSTTSIPTSAWSPGGSGVVSGQFIGRTIIFDANTTTAALQGQATNITANTSGATPTFTVTALTTAPSSGDTFSVV